MKIVFLAFLSLLGGSSIVCSDDLPVALAFANGAGTNSSLPTVRGLIDQVLGSMSHQANRPLSSIMPEASRISLAAPNRIEQCYDSSIGESDELVNIFKQPLDEILLKFVNTFKSWLIDHDFKEFKSRIKTLLANIVYVAGQVLECALNTDPNYVPTRLGLTPFAIYTHAEFVAQFSGNSLLAQNDTKIGDDEKHENVSLGERWIDPHACKIPADPELLKGVTAFDWRYKGVVTEVRHQGGCRSCYIFSAIGALESAYMIQVDNSSLVRFSEQQFVDCIDGCKGGTMPKVWNVATKDGLVLADRYPHKYVAETLECMLNQSKPVFATLEDYCEDRYLSKDEQLMTMIYKYGPTSVAIFSSSPNFAYLRGPWNEPCSSDDVDHAVLAVGWNENYWIIKNSWGDQWGLHGYLYLPRRQTNLCGIYDRAGLPFFHKR